MKFTSEQLTKAKAAKSVEELLKLAEENAIELTGEEAAKYFSDLHKEGEIADDELDNVAGGCGDDEEEEQKPTTGPKYSVGQHVTVYWYTVDTRVSGTIISISPYPDGGNGYLYIVRRDDGGEETFYLDYNHVILG